MWSWCQLVPHEVTRVLFLLQPLSSDPGKGWVLPFGCCKSQMTVLSGTARLLPSPVRWGFTSRPPDPLCACTNTSSVPEWGWPRTPSVFTYTYALHVSQKVCPPGTRGTHAQAVPPWELARYCFLFGCHCKVLFPPVICFCAPPSCLHLQSPFAAASPGGSVSTLCLSFLAPDDAACTSHRLHCNTADIGVESGEMGSSLATSFPVVREVALLWTLAQCLLVLFQGNRFLSLPGTPR